MPKQSFIQFGVSKKHISMYTILNMDDIAEVNLGGDIYIARDKPGILVHLVKADTIDDKGNVYGVAGADEENKKRKAYVSMLMGKIRKEPEKTHYTTKSYVFFDTFNDVSTTTDVCSNIVVEHRKDVSSMTESEKLKEIRELQRRLNELKRSSESYEIDVMDMLDSRGYDADDSVNVVGYECSFLRGLNELITDITPEAGTDETYCDAIWKSYKLWERGKGEFDMEFKRVAKILRKIDHYVLNIPDRFKVKNLKSYLKYVAKKVYENDIGDEYLGQDAPVERYAPPEALYEMIDGYDW